MADDRLSRAHRLAASGQVVQAELLLVALLRDDPHCAEAARGIAQLAMQRNDWHRAADHFAQARAASADATQDLLPHVHALWEGGRNADAIAELGAYLQSHPDDSLAWLQWAELQDASDDPVSATRGRFQAITRAQKRGRWVDESTTEPQFQDLVRRSIDSLRVARREYLGNSFDSVRREHGAREMRRVECALQGYLGEADATPPDPRQRPTFLYFPGLPDLPYHDPYLQPWAGKMRDAWTTMRDEAATLLSQDAPLEDFLGFKPGQSREGYVGGCGPAPSWDAFFFYRHGRRYDENHARCPRTSAVLESIELCRIDRQAPEVCFSVLRPGSTIMAHHGVTNTRLVFHLPLIVPPDCALNVVDAGEHHWVAGEPMMFDDTFRHEAWNRSDQTRVIVLMDCWNPHLTPPEKLAVKDLVEAIDLLERSPC